MLRPALWYVHLASCPYLFHCSVTLRMLPGSEVDLDLGNYERYLAVTLAGDNNITTGKIYQHVCYLISLRLETVL